MTTYAVYRCLYGEDYVRESILSIIDHVDRVFVFWTNKPWGNVSECIYKGVKVKFPEKFDDVVQKIRDLNNSKIILIEQTKEMNPYSVPWNLYTTLINNYVIPNHGKPDIFIIPEVDHVFRKDQVEAAFNEFIGKGYQSAKTRQIELWKTHLFRIPERAARIGVVFWNMTNLSKLPTTKGNGETSNIHVLDSFVHNFGFAISEKVMYWKHLTALAFSSVIKDSIPDENWLDMWMTWDYETNNKDLEISKQYRSSIPCAIPYNGRELPEKILLKIYNETNPSDIASFFGQA